MKKRATLQVRYSGTPDKTLDEKIRKYFEDVMGFEWYAQGFDYGVKTRDINFTYEEK